MKYLILCYFVVLSYSINATMRLSVGVRNGQQNLLCIKEDLRGGNNSCCESPDYCTVRTNQACCNAGVRSGQKSCRWIPGGAIQCYAVGTTCTVTDSNKNRGNCVLEPRSYGDKRPVTAQCTSNYTGTCSYRCNNGNIDKVSSTCKRSCSGTPDSLKCQSVTNITHNQANVTRLCKSGYTGQCTYTCSDGTLGGSSAGCTQGSLCDLATFKRDICPPTTINFKSVYINTKFSVQGYTKQFVCEGCDFCWIKYYTCNNGVFSHIWTGIRGL